MNPHSTLRNPQSTMRYNPIPTEPTAPATAPPLPKPQPPAAAPPPSPAPAVKKVSFAGITTKKAKPAAADKYPTFLADDQVKAAVDWLIANNPIPDQIKQVKADLAVQVTPFYFEQASGKVDVPSSVLVPGTTGLVTVTFPSRYDSATEEVLQPILGGRLGQFFRQAFKLEIDGDKIPADQAQELVAELSALFEKHGCADALAVKDQLVPIADFHAKRHLDLTVEQNLALNAVCRIQTRVSPKK